MSRTAASIPPRAHDLEQLVARSDRGDDVDATAFEDLGDALAQEQRVIGDRDAQGAGVVHRGPPFRRQVHRSGVGTRLCRAYRVGRRARRSQFMGASRRAHSGFSDSTHACGVGARIRRSSASGEDHGMSSIDRPVCAAGSCGTSPSRCSARSRPSAARGSPTGRPDRSRSPRSRAPLGESVGYYALVVVRGVRGHARSMRVRRLTGRGRRAWAATWLTARSVAAEFGPAELVDSFLVRPGLLWAAVARLGRQPRRLARRQARRRRRVLRSSRSSRSRRAAASSCPTGRVAEASRQRHPPEASGRLVSESLPEGALR